MFLVEMMPAEYGDALLVSWGKNEKSLRHILIDGGLTKTTGSVAKRLAELGKPAPLELLVVTHIDNDHINGIRGVLAKTPALVAPKKIWFNGWEQIKRFNDRAGAAQGNDLMRTLAAGWKKIWHRDTIFVPPTGGLPTLSLGGKMKLTLLSPNGPKLTKLARVWAKTPPEQLADDRASTKSTRARLDKHTVDQLAAIPFDEDGAEANGSSIAFLLEAEGKRVLFGADAHPTVLLESLDRLSPKKKVKVDALKLPHHGSEGNISIDLLNKIECSKYLVSSNGVRFEHPDDVALARVVRTAASPTLYFNYASKRNERWRNAEFARSHGYTAVFPPAKRPGLVVEI